MVAEKMMETIMAVQTMETVQSNYKFYINKQYKDRIF